MSQHYDLMNKANRHFWAELRRIVAEILKERPDIPSAELDKLAVARADKAREKFIEERTEFTHA